MPDSLNISSPQAQAPATDSAATSAHLINARALPAPVIPTGNDVVAYPDTVLDTSAFDYIAASATDISAIQTVPEVIENTLYREQPSSADGIKPAMRGDFPEGGTPVTAMLVGTLLLAGVSAPSLARALRTYAGELLTVRRRENAFDDNHSVSFPAALLAAVVTIVFCGCEICYVPAFGIEHSFVNLAMATGAFAVYYLFRLTAYAVTGYAFATAEGRRQWLEGFAASEAYAGVMMIAPAMLSVCIPSWRPALAVCALAIYCLFRFIFIIKGFKIFYSGFGSLLYFILYLCSLEIIPVLFAYRCAIVIAGMDV